MAGTGIGEIFVGVAIKEAMHRTLGPCIDYLIDKYKLKDLRQYKKTYIDYCQKNLIVKTIASNEKSFHIDDIYVPIDIRKSGHEISFEVGNTVSLDESKAIIIRGLAGQGKSTVLRKLLSNTANKSQRLPLFYELKNYTGGDIEDSLLKHFQSVGIQLSRNSIEKLLEDSNVKVFLDAFDETKPEYRNELIDEIKKLIHRYKCHVICTTRPDTEIDSIAEFQAYNVCELNQEQIFKIIHKVAADKDKATELCAALERSPLHGTEESILKSPILVVLFCISYNLGEEIPSTLSQFYSNIFETVFYRHDNIKGKVNRVRHWNDDRRIYRVLFETLCFISQRSGFTSFTKDTLSEQTGLALNYVQESEKLSDKISSEIVSITNLIIEDGYNEYRFIHKSIQEFFSASFIRELPHEKKIKFYAKCIKEQSFYSIFANTLFFLKELDYFDYCEHFLIPSVSDLLGLNREAIDSDNFTIPEELIRLYLDRMFIRTRLIEVTGLNKKKSYEPEYELPHFRDSENYPHAYTKLFNFAIGLSMHHDDFQDIGKKIRSSGRQEEQGWFAMSLRDLIESKDLEEDYLIGLLYSSVAFIFMSDYNRAISSTANRVQTLARNKVFDFD